jgi:uncharacterized repeat protein (TIGR03943 family)
MGATDHTHAEEHSHEQGDVRKITLQAWLKPAILAGLGLYFNYNLASGNLTNYINVRFAWLSYLAAMLFLLLAAVTAYDLINTRRQDSQHTHDHGLSWAGLAVVAIPLVLGTLIPSRPLGANAVEGDLASGITAVGGATAFTSDPLTWNVLDWLRAINGSDDLSGFNGQQADVVGFVYRAETFPPTTFMVARFVISCCAADAAAIGLPVIWDDAPELAEDTWVRVRGAFELGEFGGNLVPILHAETVERVPEPEHPYLYP